MGLLSYFIFVKAIYPMTLSPNWSYCFYFIIPKKHNYKNQELFGFPTFWDCGWYSCAPIRLCTFALYRALDQTFGLSEPITLNWRNAGFKHIQLVASRLAEVMFIYYTAGDMVTKIKLDQFGLPFKPVCGTHWHSPTRAGSLTAVAQGRFRLASLFPTTWREDEEKKDRVEFNTGQR